MPCLRVKIVDNMRVFIYTDDETIDVNYKDGYDVETVVAIVNNPRLRAEGDVGGKAEVKDMGKIVEKCIEDRDRANALLKFVKGSFIDLDDLLPYGKWVLSNIAVEAGWDNAEKLPVKYAVGGAVLFGDVLSVNIKEMTHNTSWKFIPTMRVYSIADLLYPVYYGVVENEEVWIYNSLESVLKKVYYDALKLHIDLYKEYKNNKHFGAVLLDLGSAVSILRRKINLISMYVSDSNKFWDFTRKTILGLLFSADDLKDMDDDEIKWIAKFKSMVKDVLVKGGS